MTEKNETGRVTRSEVWKKINRKYDDEDTIDATIIAEELHQRESLTTKPGDPIENPFSTQ